MRVGMAWDDTITLTPKGRSRYVLSARRPTAGPTLWSAYSRMGWSRVKEGEYTGNFDFITVAVSDGVKTWTNTITIAVRRGNDENH